MKTMFSEVDARIAKARELQVKFSDAYDAQQNLFRCSNQSIDWEKYDALESEKKSLSTAFFRAFDSLLKFMGYEYTEKRDRRFNDTYIRYDADGILRYLEIEVRDMKGSLTTPYRSYHIKSTFEVA